MSEAQTNSRSYKIVKAVGDVNRLVVHAEFLENGKKVGEINHGFSLKLSEKEVEAEVKKACQTFFADQALFAKNKVQDEKDKQTQAKIEVLAGKEQSI